MSIAGLHHGGAEKVVASLCRNLNQEKFSITVCWRQDRGAIGDALLEEGIDVIGLPEIEPDVSPYLRFLVLKRLITKKQIDIIHTHDTGALADAAQCKLFGSKVRLLHTFHFGNYPNLRKSYLWMEMLFSRFANQLVAVGYEQAVKIRDSLHLSGSHLSTLYNGVEWIDTQYVENILEPYKSFMEHSVVIGSISTLTEQKGITNLLDTAAIMKKRGMNCIFLIIGDGPLKDGLEEKCQRLNLSDSVFFLGWINNAAQSILPNIDIFCQSSLWEANSIVLLESMAAGLPVVTTNVGESPHVINEGVNGYVVESRNPVYLADALTRLVNDPEMRKAMGRKARDKFAKNYTVEKMIDGYEMFYQQLIT